MNRFDQTTHAITRIVRMQNHILDYTGHVRRGLSRDDVRITVAEIQRLRISIGWEPVDMQGRYRAASANRGVRVER